MEINGYIKQMMPLQSGTSAKGTAWQKQEFIIEELDKGFPNSIVITAFGDEKITALSKFKANDHVSVRFDCSVREYNGRMFNNITMFTINPLQSVSQQPVQPQPQVQNQQQFQQFQQQFQAQPVNQGAFAGGNGGGSGDLPF